MNSEIEARQLGRRTALRRFAGGAAVSAVAAPAIVGAQAGVLKIGHLTPLTGFLGPIGEYAVMGVKLAVEEVNEAGGVLGRKIDLLSEDSVNPQTASTKAQRMIERDGVDVLLGEISSASGLAIAQVSGRNRTPFFQTGCNSDELRGKSCNRFMFHIEAANTMYVKAVGEALLRGGQVKGKKWYSLTADYAFGHDLLKVTQRWFAANGATHAGGDLVPTDLNDFSPYILKLRQNRPDLVMINLAGNQTTNFLKQYNEFRVAAGMASQCENTEFGKIHTSLHKALGPSA
jgi:branched-chain amino acid transport system substrate-binding protein